MDALLTKRTWILAIMVAVGFSLVWAIPTSGVFRSSQLIEELPNTLLGRVGVELEVSQKEKDTLADDTTFARKRYFDNKEENADPYVDVSVVFSGKDINNSIHRPEICLVAQGWTLSSETYVMVDFGERRIPFKEIVSARTRVSTDGSASKNSKGEAIIDTRVLYYTFAGAEAIVAGHYERTWEDIKTRILQGTDQQWAYVTISMDVTKNPLDDIKEKSYFKEFDVEQTRAALKEFTSDAMPLLLNN